jgi:hypothetical protein
MMKLSALWRLTDEGGNGLITYLRAPKDVFSQLFFTTGGVRL